MSLASFSRTDNLSLQTFKSTSFLAVITFLYILYIREGTKLRKIPGPFWASITKLWVVRKQMSFQRPVIDMALHEKYGPIVRIAPNEIMVSSPTAFKTIYGASSKFRKADWYIGTGDCGWQGEDALDFLPEQNMEKYRMQRRAIGPAYTAAAVKDYEEVVDYIITKNIKIMRERSKQVGVVEDLDFFLNMLLSDCYLTATFSTCKDMVESGKEDGSISAIHEAWKYMHVIGYFPYLHRFITWFSRVFSSVSWVSRWSGFARFMPWAVAGRGDVPDANPYAVFPLHQLKSRLFSNRHTANEKKDILAKLIHLQSTRPGLADKDHWINNMCLTNLGAGVETTAITIGNLIENSMRHPSCQEKIREEIREVRKRGGSLKMGEFGEMPFLDAYLRESMRLGGIIGMPLMRVVPEGGCVIDGFDIPGGTTIGINMWVLGRDKSLYGEDADIWRPERWLEMGGERLKYLETYNMYFGTSTRSCPGKYLAQAIYNKLIPLLFENFEWRYADPDAEKKIRCAFVVKWVGLMVLWESREFGGGEE